MVVGGAMAQPTQKGSREADAKGSAVGTFVQLQWSDEDAIFTKKRKLFMGHPKTAQRAVQLGKKETSVVCTAR